MSYHWNQLSHSASSALHYHPKFTILLDLLLSPLSQTQIPPCWGQTSFSKGSSLPDSCWGGSLPACWLLVPWSQPSQAFGLQLSGGRGAHGQEHPHQPSSLLLSSRPSVFPPLPLSQPGSPYRLLSLFLWVTLKHQQVTQLCHMGSDRWLPMASLRTRMSMVHYCIHRSQHRACHIEHP